MSNQTWPTSIAIISEDEDDIELLTCMLSEQFKLTSARNVSEIDALLNNNSIDLCILSEQWTSCTALSILEKSQAMTRDKERPYIILFGCNNLELKIKAYELGVNEFLNKPFDIFDFNIRLSNLLDLRGNVRLAQSQSETASKTAMIAMETSSELGVIMRYTDRINGISVLNELGSALISTCKAIGIKCSYQFRALGETLTQGNPLGSFDEQLINEFYQRGATIDFGSRSIFNKPLVSVLAKNMPQNDTLKYGRLKEHLQLIINATENKLRIINSERLIKKQQNTSTLAIIQNSYQALENVSIEFTKLSEGIDSTMSWLKIELEQKLITLGLSEEQETALMDMVDDTIDRLAISYNTGVEIDNQVNRIKKFLSHLI